MKQAWARRRVRTQAERHVPFRRLIAGAETMLDVGVTGHGLWYTLADPCYLCNRTYRTGMQWDHIEPRDSFAPGENKGRNNGARVCQYCQAKKGGKSLIVFLANRAAHRAHRRKAA